MKKDFYIPSNVKRCKCCGKLMDLSFKDVENYVYKLPKPCDKQKFDYYCSYSCYREAQNKVAQTSSRKEKAKLLNKYNGVLSLQEANVVEGMFAYMNQRTESKISIKTREDYEKFMITHKKYYQMLVNDMIYGK